MCGAVTVRRVDADAHLLLVKGCRSLVLPNGDVIVPRQNSARCRKLNHDSERRSRLSKSRAYLLVAGTHQDVAERRDAGLRPASRRQVAEDFAPAPLVTKVAAKMKGHRSCCAGIKPLGLKCGVKRHHNG